MKGSFVTLIVWSVVMVLAGIGLGAVYYHPLHKAYKWAKDALSKNSDSPSPPPPPPPSN